MKSPLLVSIVEDVACVRVCGMGDFKKSLILKKYVETLLETKVNFSLLAIDLGNCTGMDSTFMGGLANLSIVLKTGKGANLKIFSANENHLKLLNELGMDLIFEAVPQSLKKEILDSDFQEIERIFEAKGNSAQDYRQHILRAHERLINENEGNQERFSSLVEQLRKESEKD